MSCIAEKRIQEINLFAKVAGQRETISIKKRMPIARCTCNFEILVVPDLKAMNRAIKNHLAIFHKKGYAYAEEKLVRQVLLLASQMGLEA